MCVCPVLLHHHLVHNHHHGQELCRMQLHLNHQLDPQPNLVRFSMIGLRSVVRPLGQCLGLIVRLEHSLHQAGHSLQLLVL